MTIARHYMSQPYGALMLDELEEYHEIIAGFTEIIKNGTSPGIAYHNRALAHWEIGEVEEALRDFGEAELAIPDSHMPSQLKGMLLAKLGHLDEAIESLNRAASISPNAATVRRTRADLLAKAGRLEQSLRDLDHAIQLEPGFERTREVRDQVFARLCDSIREKDGLRRT